MLEINVKEVRSNLSSILDKVEKGEDIVITRRGKRVAKISNLDDNPIPLRSLMKFRENIQIKGSSLSQTVVSQREEERY
jgi:prevent-host-death family protein